MSKPILVTRSSMPDLEEYVSEIKELWDSHWLTNMGVKHEKFKKELLKYLQVSNITLFTNGHSALESAIGAFELSGEVITTPFTFASTTHAIVRNNLKPVFCDINENNYTIDVNKIERLINDKTSAILPVHIYGIACDVEKIDRIAEKHGLKVIYDAAQAFGVTVDGIGIGNFGHASAFSFHATKVFNTVEGGAVAFRLNDLEKKLDMLKNFGITDYEKVEGIGGNSKMSEFQAAMGICNLRHLDEEIKKRRRVVERYRKNLANVKGIKIMLPQPGVISNSAYFPVVFDDSVKSRESVFQALKVKNIFARRYFYPLTPDFECYKNKFDSALTPIAKRVASQVLTLPLYADLDLLDVDRICDIIKNC